MSKLRPFSKWKSLSASILATVLVLSGCGGNAGGDKPAASQPATGAGNDTVKIGVLLSQAGTFAPLAESVKNGFELYLDEHNQKLGNRKVEVKYEDDEANPQTALRKYRKLVSSDKVDIMVGPLSSSVAYALRDEVEKDKMVLIDPNAAADDLSWEKRSDYIYRISLSNWQNGTSASAYIAKNVGKTAVTLAPDYPAGHEEISAFKAGFEAAGGKVVKELYPKLGTTDYATFMTEIAQTKPDLVYVFFVGDRRHSLCEAIR